MKAIFLTLLCLIILNVHSQPPYSWTPGVNPGWTSVNNGSGGALQWRPACNAVTTNCNGNYSNNQNTSYTSPVIDASCSNASTLSISFFMSGNAEWQFDFLFMEYSLDGGTTWINPYGPNVGLTGNAGVGLTWALPPIPTSNNFRFRFTFTSDFIIAFSGYRITNFQIVCNVVLPIEILSFTGENLNTYNHIEWISASEINNDYFQIERSTNGIDWELLTIVNGAGNSNKNIYYSYRDTGFKNELNYYRLSQTDFDGTIEYFNPISIDNRNKNVSIIKRLNIMGQEVTDSYKGIVIYYYDDGSIEKKYKQ